MSEWITKLASLGGAYSENTIRSYRSDFAGFEVWCQKQGCSALPAASSAVADYIAALALTHAPASVRRRVAAISRIHQMFDQTDPGKTEDVKMAVRRLLRARGQRQRQAAGLRSNLRDALIDACGAGLIGARNRALISVGYDTLCRRSELAALLAQDVATAADGSGTVLVRRSKADQLGQGRLAYLSPRSVELLRGWLDSAGIGNGPIFRGVRGNAVFGSGLCDYSVNRIIKRMARTAGVAPDLVVRLSGHSFRIGAALDMTEHGIDLVPIMHAGGWKSPEMVVRYTQQINTLRSGMALLHRSRSQASHPE